MIPEGNGLKHNVVAGERADIFSQYVDRFSIQLKVNDVKFWPATSLYRIANLGTG